MHISHRIRGAMPLVLALMAASAQAQTRPAPPAELTDERVLTAVERATHFLFADVDKFLAQAAQGLRDNGAEIAPGAVPNALGAAAGDLMLEAYALFYAGRELSAPSLNQRDPRISALREVVVAWNPPGDYQSDTYTTALQVLALSQLPPLSDVDAAMRRATQRLITGMIPRGGYTYRLAPEGNPDQSNSQYGLLGVWAAAEWGVPVPPAYWQISSAYWRRTQDASGGWSYAPGGKPTPAMTAAGLASLYVCSEYTDRSPRIDSPPDAAIERGLAALVASFDPTHDDHYYLYGLERVALAGGHKFLGKRNWYRETAQAILAQQRPDGAFVGNFNGATPGRSTAFAILHLLRGRAPVLMNKLQYPGAQPRAAVARGAAAPTGRAGGERGAAATARSGGTTLVAAGGSGGWNLRPRDSANVHAVLSRTFERRLNWQVVPFDVPVDEWLDAPILLITGVRDPEFTEQQIEQLRDYIHNGGMILSVPVGGSTNALFTNAMARCATRIAAPRDPADPRAALPPTRWRELPPTHPLLSMIEPPEPLPPLFGLSNGVREVWIHIGADLSAQWQNRVERRSAWDIPARLFLYAAGREGFRSRLHIPAPPPPDKLPAASLPIARLQFPGNWNPEPGAWLRLGQTLAREADTSLVLRDMPIEQLVRFPRAQRPKLAHLAGTGPLALTDADLRTLRDYLQGGGTLFVEAIGGDRAFARDARDLIARLVPQGRLQPIPRDYLLFNGAFARGALRIGPVDYRRTGIDPALVPPDSDPRLEFVTLNNRLAILFSEYDITHGLLDFNTAGIAGYSPSSAQALARNIALFSGVNFRP